MSIDSLGGLQAYAFGQANGKWLIVGGRLDGLHRRQPFASFDIAGNNNQLIVIDPIAKQRWVAPLSSLSVNLQEQLSSTNMEFEQEGNYLYIIGGYGYNAATASRKTFNFLTAIDVPAVISAVISGSNFVNHFRQISNANFAVTGGHLKKINGTYYLLGGNQFDGNYNPMGNPTYVQVYTNAIRKFTLSDNGTTINVNFLTPSIDAVNLHRRDYNAVAQILPNGAEGISMFSGVFQPTVDLPFLNSITVDSIGHYPVSGFQQYYNHYHCAVLPIYSAAANNMHNFFFGGISQYYDSAGTLVQDNNVPFVKTIARVTRDASGQMTEYKLPIELPAYLGASAEFIPNPSISNYANGVINYDALVADTTLVGYIYGGISSSAKNVFFSNSATASLAYSGILKVYVIKSANNSTNFDRINKESTSSLRLSVSPNPGSGKITIKFFLNKQSDVRLQVFSESGQELYNEVYTGLPATEHIIQTENLGEIGSGNFILQVSTATETARLKIIRD